MADAPHRRPLFLVWGNLVVPLAGAGGRIGREARPGLTVITDPTVSRLHLEWARHHRLKIRVRDLGSAHGTELIRADRREAGAPVRLDSDWQELGLHQSLKIGATGPWRLVAAPPARAPPAPGWLRLRILPGDPPAAHLERSNGPGQPGPQASPANARLLAALAVVGDDGGWVWCDSRALASALWPELDAPHKRLTLQVHRAREWLARYGLANPIERRDGATRLALAPPRVVIGRR